MRLIVAGRSRSGTTILRDVLSHPPNSHITNEMRIYNQLTVETDVNNYFKFLSTKLGPRNKIPMHVTPQEFLRRCKTNTTGKNMLQGLYSVEKVLFGDKYEVFGDKSGVGYYLLDIVSILKEDVKIIHIYRDGRDSTASGLRHSEGGKNHRPWATTSAYKNSLHWAEKLNIWFDIREKLKTNQYLEIRFEDFIVSPYLNAQKLSIFTGISEGTLRKSEDHLIKRDTAHIGYYKKWISNWKKDLAPEAIEVLHKLKYI